MKNVLRFNMGQICKNCKNHIHCSKTSECDCPICNDHEVQYCTNTLECDCTICVQIIEKTPDFKKNE